MTSRSQEGDLPRQSKDSSLVTSSLSVQAEYRGGIEMTLIRGYSKVDEQGRIPIPKNMARETELKPGQLVEIKLHGPNMAQYLVIKPRKSAR